MHIVLHEPEIPGNTGSIGRVCVGTGTALHLVGKLGFSLDESYVRRAGLDYWKNVDLHLHADLDALIGALPGSRLLCFTAHGGTRYDRIEYRTDDALVFGSESRGFPQAVRDRLAEHMVYVPVNPMIRSLNLANVATLVLYEGLRQQGFAGLETERFGDPAKRQAGPDRTLGNV